MSRAERRRLSLRKQVALDVGTGAMVAESAAAISIRARRISWWAIIISLIALLNSGAVAIVFLKGLVQKH